MPFARLTIADPALDPDVQRDLARTITVLLADVLDKEPEVAVCHINLVEPSRWYVAGQQDTRGTGAHLEVSITAGTNTVAQKAAFLREAYAAIGDSVGPLADAVYVALYELDAASYGYNGVSQAQRKHDNPDERD